MCAKYAFYKNPPKREGGDDGSLHARVVSRGRFGTEELAREIANNCSFSSGVVKGMLDALAKSLEMHLKYGETVDLEGIGTFSITLKCPKGITDPKQIRAESVNFNNIVYRPSPQLKHKMKSITLSRASLPKRKDQTEEDRLSNILAHLKEKQRIISTTDCMSFNQCSRYQALKDLKKLHAQGLLTWVGRGKQKYYMLAEDWRKKEG